MVLGNDQTQLFYWPLHTSDRTIKHERVWVKEWHRTDLPVTKSHRRVKFQRLIETIKTATYNTLVKVMAKFPQLTPMICPHLCACVNKKADQVLHAPDAIHFWGGMEHAPSMALEMAVKADENFENVVESWNYVIGQVNIFYTTSKGQTALEDQALTSYLHLANHSYFHCIGANSGS